MNENLTIKPVEFLGDTLMAARDADGTVWAGVRWICNGIGLSRGQANGEVAKAQNDEVLKQGCMKFRAGVFDANNDTVALRLDFVPLWLAKISVTPTMQAENPGVADKLVQYQLKAKDVLAAAFLPAHKPARFTPKATSAGEVASLVKINRIIMKDQGSSGSKIARQTGLLYRQFGVDAIPDYVEPGFEQLTLETTTVTTTVRLPERTGKFLPKS